VAFLPSRFQDCRRCLENICLNLLMQQILTPARKLDAPSSVFRGAALLFALVYWLPATAYAHPIPFSYLDLRLNGNQIEGTLVAHIADLAHDLDVTPPESLLEPRVAESKKDEVEKLIRSRLLLASDGQPIDVEVTRVEPIPDRQAVSFELRIRTTVGPGVLKIQCSLFPYDPEHQTFLNVYEGDRLVRQEIFTRDRQTLIYYTGSRQGWFVITRTFIPAGVYHIFTGPDHLLFIVGLLLMGGSLLRLLSIVTAFTIAHSITLSLAALDLVNPSPRLIEPAIALSIVYVGVDNLMVGKTGRDMRAWIAFFFGFVHGFGFASVLREFGLPSGALGWSLFSFNFGVEIGQACIVVVVASLLAALRKRNQTLGRRILEVGSVCVILAGSYWFIQRVFF
jgi:hydrogenase/urease accessory protein HupE